MRWKVTPRRASRQRNASAEVSSGEARLAYLRESVACLERSPAAYELACALVTLGTELHDPAHLRRGLETAERCGADGLATTARTELAATEGAAL